MPIVIDFMCPLTKDFFLKDEMFFSEKMSLLGENQTEPKDTATVAWSEAATVRRTAKLRIVAPATTTVHMVRPTIST